MAAAMAALASLLRMVSVSRLWWWRCHQSNGGSVSQQPPKNTTRDSSSVHGSDGDGILSVCGGHHVVTTGKAGTVKVKGKKSKVAGDGDRGGQSGGDTVAVLVKRRKRVAHQPRHHQPPRQQHHCSHRVVVAAGVVPVTPFLQEQLR